MRILERVIMLVLIVAMILTGIFLAQAHREIVALRTEQSQQYSYLTTYIYGLNDRINDQVYEDTRLWQRLLTIEQSQQWDYVYGRINDLVNEQTRLWQELLSRNR